MTTPTPPPYTQPYSSVKKAKANPLLIVLLVIFFILDVGFGALIVKQMVARHQSDTDMPAADSGNSNQNSSSASGTSSTPNPSNTPSLFGPDIDDDLNALSDRVNEAQQKIQNENYSEASEDLTQILNEYVTLASDNNAYDEVNNYTGAAFEMYTASILEQARVWEEQSPNAALYQQIEGTLSNSLDFADELTANGLSIDPTALNDSLSSLPERYKEKYILTFNELRTGDEWSRTTAWQYMQDAASAGLVDKNNPDDPLTLRYSYALAWITQREVTEGISNGDMSADDAVSYIISVMEPADYNPVLMRDLGTYLDTCGYYSSADVIKNACFEMWNYMAYTENLYINPADMFIPGKTATNASSTIALNDFWYFNDFGDYSISDTNGVTPEGRQYIRDIFSAALSSI